MDEIKLWGQRHFMSELQEQARHQEEERQKLEMQARQIAERRRREQQGYGHRFVNPVFSGIPKRLKMDFSGNCPRNSVKTMTIASNKKPNGKQNNFAQTDGKKDYAKLAEYHLVSLIS